MKLLIGASSSKIFHLKEFAKKLEEYKIKVIPIKMRHIYTQGGGIHCATLDTVRESKLEEYF